MRTTLLIAADGIRALLRQRLLLGLMLLALAAIAIASFLLIGQRKLMTRAIADQAAANAPADPADPGTAAGAGVGKPHATRHPLGAEDRKKLASSLDMLSSVFQTAFYAAASFGGSLVSLFIFSTAVASEIRRGTIRLTLTKPVSRRQYLLGKYLGGIAVMAGYGLIASAALVLFAHIGQMELSPAMKFAPWLMFCRQLMLGSLALLLSLYLNPFVASILAFLATNDFYSHRNPLYYVLPSYSPFQVFTQTLQGTLVSGRDVLLLSAYALDFVVLMLLLALWRFRTKELI